MLNIGGKVSQQSVNSGNIQKVQLISFSIYYLDVSVSGYLSDVSPIKIPKDKKRRYLISRCKMMTHYIGVFLSPWRGTGIINDSSHSCIEIKLSRSNDNNNEIIANDFSSVKTTELNFERKTIQSNFWWSKSVLCMT